MLNEIKSVDAVVQEFKRGFADATERMQQILNQAAVDAGHRTFYLASPAIGGTELMDGLEL